ncbi:hypothetical protein HanIR_Chr12g0611431 [Helianthus annuus]|nr:hypothetical protein HanIR_Chr12g0611431 [Helianthus annuus]
MKSTKLYTPYLISKYINFYIFNQKIKNVILYVPTINFLGLLSCFNVVMEGTNGYIQAPLGIVSSSDKSFVYSLMTIFFSAQTKR